MGGKRPPAPLAPTPLRHDGRAVDRPLLSDDHFRTCCCNTQKTNANKCLLHLTNSEPITFAMEKLQNPRTSPKKQNFQDNVLQSKHPQLREKLDFQAIFPHLNQRGLLPPSLDQRKLVDERITVRERIDMLITHMPKCGKEEYLSEFIDCLRESEYGTGTAHSELAETLDTAYVRMRNSSQCESINSLH